MTKEERKEYSRLYYQKHKAQILADCKERYANDKDYRKAKINNAQLYNETNKDKVKKRKSKYYENHKQEFKDYFSEYYNQNKDAVNHKRKYKYRKEKVITQDSCVE